MDLVNSNSGLCGDYFFIVLKHEAQFVHGEFLFRKSSDCCIVRLHAITEHKQTTQSNLTATPWILSLHLSRIPGVLHTFNLLRHSVVPSGCSFHHNCTYTLIDANRFEYYPGDTNRAWGINISCKLTMGHDGSLLE